MAQRKTTVSAKRETVSLLGRFIFYPPRSRSRPSSSESFDCENEDDDEDEFNFYAPNLSNIFALACMRRIKYFASNTPSEPLFAPVSVKRSSLSEPLTAECSSTGCACHEWPLAAHGVEWSPVMASTSGFSLSKIGRAASKSSIAFIFAMKLPSSPALSVYL